MTRGYIGWEEHAWQKVQDRERAAMTTTQPANGLTQHEVTAIECATNWEAAYDGKDSHVFHANVAWGHIRNLLAIIDRLTSQAPEGWKPISEHIDERMSITDTQKETLLEVYALIRHGYKFINLHIRKDGREYHFQADWLRQLLCSIDAAPSTPGEGK